MVVGGGGDEGHIYSVGLDILVVELVVVFCCCCISLGFWSVVLLLLWIPEGRCVCEEGIYLPPVLEADTPNSSNCSKPHPLP